MKSLLIIGFCTAACLSQISCTSKSNLEMGGVPGWLKAGAKISDEPEPRKFDSAILDYEEESGPIAFRMNTDKREYDAPPAPKKESTEVDPLERGRDYRIKRLVR